MSLAKKITQFRNRLGKSWTVCAVAILTPCHSGRSGTWRGMRNARWGNNSPMVSDNFEKDTHYRLKMPAGVFKGKCKGIKIGSAALPLHVVLSGAQALELELWMLAMTKKTRRFLFPECIQQQSCFFLKENNVSTPVCTEVMKKRRQKNRCWKEILTRNHSGNIPGSSHMFQWITTKQQQPLNGNISGVTLGSVIGLLPGGHPQHHREEPLLKEQ